MADQTIIFTKNAPARELPCALPPRRPDARGSVLTFDDAQLSAPT